MPLTQESIFIAQFLSQRCIGNSGRIARYVGTARCSDGTVRNVSAFVHWGRPAVWSIGAELPG